MIWSSVTCFCPRKLLHKSLGNCSTTEKDPGARHGIGQPGWVSRIGHAQLPPAMNAPGSGRGGRSFATETRARSTGAKVRAKFTWQGLGHFTPAWRLFPPGRWL